MSDKEGDIDYYQKKKVTRLNLFNEGSDPYATPRSMPYDSYDLNSLQQPDAGEDWDEMQRVSDSTGKGDMRNETSPGLGRNKKGAFAKVEKLNHSFSVNNSEEAGSFDLGKKQLTDIGSDKNVSSS